jgi:hypothetical protein
MNICNYISMIFYSKKYNNKKNKYNYIKRHYFGYIKFNPKLPIIYEEI